VQTQAKPSALIRVGYVVVTIGLVLAVATAVGFVAISLFAATGGDGTSIRTTVTIPSEHLRSLPVGVEIADMTPVTLKIDDPTPGQSVMTLLTGLPWFALGLVVLFLIRRILSSVRRGDPFNAANVRRLRTIGFGLLIGGPFAMYLGQMLMQWVAESARIQGVGLHLEVPGTLPLAGLGVLILAQVFAHGVRLREDVEGTV
jgi:hypothetical protein